MRSRHRSRQAARLRHTARSRAPRARDTPCARKRAGSTRRAHDTRALAPHRALAIRHALARALATLSTLAPRARSQHIPHFRLARRPHRTARGTPARHTLSTFRSQPTAPRHCRRLLITRAHTQPERHRRPRPASSPARRRLALASSSRADRAAQCTALHARTLCAPRLARDTLSTIARHPHEHAPQRADAP